MVTYVLVAVNIAIFLAQVAMEAASPDEYAELLDKLMVSRHGFAWWQLITASFLHLGWMHIAGNSLFLWVFGPNIEDRLGKIGYLAFYILGGAAAMGMHLAASKNPAAGASGSIAALTGAYLIMFPKTNIKVFVLWGMVGVTWVSAWWFIGLSIIWDLAGQASGATGVAHAAHLGGDVFGAIVAYALLGLKLVPREPYDLFTSSRQAYRRQQFKAANAEATQQVKAKVGRGLGSGAGPASVPSHVLEAQEELARARAAVSDLMSKGDMPGAVAAYKKLADTYGHLPKAACLSRERQYNLANHLYAAGDYPSAAYAYERFLECYPKDSEAPAIRLLLGRLNARHLNDPVRAKALLTEAVSGLWDEQTKAMAKAELDALG